MSNEPLSKTAKERAKRGAPVRQQQTAHNRFFSDPVRTQKGNTSVTVDNGWKRWLHGFPEGVVRDAVAIAVLKMVDAGMLKVGDNSPEVRVYHANECKEFWFPGEPCNCGILSVTVAGETVYESAEEKFFAGQEQMRGWESGKRLKP